MIMRKRNGENIRLRVPLYRQTTDFTCGACATLMVWRYFDRKAQLSKQNEFMIWTETAALPFRFSSPYRIATFFLKKGFETKLLMSQKMSSGNLVALECCQVDPAERKLFLEFFRAHNEILKKQIASTFLDRKPTLSDIRNALSAHNPAILLVDSYYTLKARGARNPPHLPHWIVVTGYKDEKNHINDPINEINLKPGKMTLESRVLKKAMDANRRFGWPPALIVAGRKQTN